MLIRNICTHINIHMKQKQKQVLSLVSSRHSNHYNNDNIAVLSSKMAKSPEEEHPVKAFGWAARDSSGHLSPFKFSRR